MLVVFLALAFAAAGVGSQFGPSPWFEALHKPSWNPPDWVFAPVWTSLYAMMAVAAWLVWRTGARAPLAWWLVQLVLNAAWSWLFFGLRRPDLAFADIVVLWVAIAATIVAFAPASRTAALLLAPYLAWVTFATALNGTIWRLNAS
jgi:translocator protein